MSRVPYMPSPMEMIAMREEGLTAEQAREKYGIKVPPREVRERIDARIASRRARVTDRPVGVRRGDETIEVMREIMAMATLTAKVNDQLVDENRRLRQALGDAISAPKGVVPDSALPFYDAATGTVKKQPDVTITDEDRKAALEEVKARFV